MKRCRYFCLVLLFLLLIPQWPVEQNWWKKQLSKVSPHKEHPFANTHQVSAVRSCLPTAKYFRVSPCARWDVEQKLVRGHPSSHTAHLQTVRASSLLPAFSGPEQLLTHCPVRKLSERLFKCLKNFLLLATSHSACDSSGSQSPEPISVQISFPPKGGRAATATPWWVGIIMPLTLPPDTSSPPFKSACWF